MAHDVNEWKIHNKMNPQTGRSQDWVGLPGDGSIGARPSPGRPRL